jgi:hypothetical protein
MKTHDSMFLEHYVTPAYKSLFMFCNIVVFWTFNTSLWRHKHIAIVFEVGVIKERIRANTGKGNYNITGKEGQEANPLCTFIISYSINECTQQLVTKM